MRGGQFKSWRSSGCILCALINASPRWITASDVPQMTSDLCRGASSALMATSVVLLQLCRMAPHIPVRVCKWFMQPENVGLCLSFSFFPFLSFIFLFYFWGYLLWQIDFASFFFLSNLEARFQGPSHNLLESFWGWLPNLTQTHWQNGFLIKCQQGQISLRDQDETLKQVCVCLHACVCVTCLTRHFTECRPAALFDARSFFNNSFSKDVCSVVVFLLP